MSTRASRGRRPRNWLGNNLWEHTLFNDRLQPIEIGLGTSQGGTQKLALTFAYESSPGAEDNNGYDRYGNRRASGQNVFTDTPQNESDFESATNRLTSALTRLRCGARSSYTTAKGLAEVLSSSPEFL